MQVRPFTVSLAVVLVGFSPLASWSQESANQELDSCIRKERLAMTAKGAVAGAALGLLKSALGGGKADDAKKNVLAGAVIGGAGGFITSWYTAVKSCYENNPRLIPEARLQRGADYEEAKQKVNYRPEMGPMTKIIEMPTTVGVKAGTSNDIPARFVALTPDGTEQEIEISRRLYIKDQQDSPEKEVVLPSDRRKVAAGEITDSFKLTIPENSTPGATVRYQISIAPVGGASPSTASTVATVN